MIFVAMGNVYVYGGDDVYLSTSIVSHTYPSTDAMNYEQAFFYHLSDQSVFFNTTTIHVIADDEKVNDVYVIDEEEEDLNVDSQV